ncbi:MAG: CRISPR-associated protein Cmr3, partial [Clostridia bacterium]|nr:CRISPR-associated protein Cmr3 [Clostridia bacterium]
EVRVHIAIDRETSAARESLLFVTEGLVFKEGMGLALRATTADPDLARILASLTGLHTLGGERRLAAVLPDPEREQAWRPPAEILGSLEGCRGLRMMLVTPAIFRNGWLPGWIDPRSLTGEPPGAKGLRLQLRGACVDRWRAVSGWSLEKGRRGPKPVRRAVPAGSVYFFERIEGNPRELGSSWLHSVSDDPQDRLDGFGLALWGSWTPSMEP